ncbi:hypothetical protein HZH68_013413 [Vespula germanica]|uniref:VOC domain-containing protein n=1 Tax=Vespula germanica TaxID=30212 RepID=A0A834JIV6_VESGE|nr:hypothetical protein HZH68_013413 [Vespula germanica]
MIPARALHFVFKIAERKETMTFYREILGMKVLRHEEFADGYEATCNGKTMIGYGPEDNHFVVELTYNYGISEYKSGNDFLGITISSKEAIDRAKSNGWPLEEENGKFVLQAPSGYKYYIINELQPEDKDPVQKVTLSSTNVDHAKAYGRIAFSVPLVEQPLIQKKIKENGNKILTDLITLNIPGKASVRVIILADPDDHEICFVDDEGFRKLSVPDYPMRKAFGKILRNAAICSRVLAAYKIPTYHKYFRPRSHRVEVAACGDPRTNGDSTLESTIRDAFPLRELQASQQTGDSSAGLNLASANTHARAGRHARECFTYHSRTEAWRHTFPAYNKNYMQRGSINFRVNIPRTNVDHAKAYGRIAFSVPLAEQPLIQKKIKENGNKILTDLITLDTPGKASVRVIILADPDDHEICFVDDEGFRKLSIPDYPSEKILDRYIAK